MAGEAIMNARNATQATRNVPGWFQLLAAAVVHQALADVGDPSLPATIRLEAQQFLAGNAEYRFWRRVAESSAALPPLPSRERQEKAS
jgi:hypothetical protein